MAFIKLTDLDLAGKRVLIRADLNVPVKDGKVTSDARITASMPTIEHCVKAGAKVMVMSHRGRPEEGKVDDENSMQPIAEDIRSLRLSTGFRARRADPHRHQDLSQLHLGNIGPREPPAIPEHAERLRRYAARAVALGGAARRYSGF